MNNLEVEGDEEEELECFQDSLDRILSSASASSATVSEDDQENGNYSPNYNSDNPPRVPIPKFPVSVSNFDVWIHGPLSIQERRKRLLKEMGLSNDPLLSRKDLDIGRSASDDHLCRRDENGIETNSDCVVPRSKSDGSATTRSSDQCNYSSLSSSVHSVAVDSNNIHVCSTSPRNDLTNKPPSGIIFRRMEKLRPFFTNSDSDCSLVRVDRKDGGCVLNSNYIGIVKEVHPLSPIKSLGNDVEVVVNELKEDSKSSKVLEIETGHQLSVEEFESCVGHSPIVQELMRRQNMEKQETKNDESVLNENGGNAGGDNGMKSKKKGGWLKSIKNVASVVAGHWERRSNDDWDTSSDKVGRRSSSGTEDGQNGSGHFPEKVRVRQYGKSWKELTALYKNQEIQAHCGSIWSIKFSLDGQYLASAGEDCVIHVWQVTESEKKGDFLIGKLEDGNLNPFFQANGYPEVTLLADSHFEKKKRSKVSLNRKSVNSEHVVVPDSVITLSEKPVCSFQGHVDDVLDLSWSKSKYLLSSSMDKTVRLWHMDSNACLKKFSHSDYVTCIQFNPVDDRYFISGSLDAKVRIWSIPERQVVDWNDLHEMVTAASYTPDGQGALVGSYNGSCRVFNTSENKLQQKSQIDLQNKRKKSHLKKITGFQFAPRSYSEVLVTSADSRIRVVEGTDLVHKYKGFRNTNSQISASLTANGKHIVSASEDSHVYIWKHEPNTKPNKTKSLTITHSHEHFHSQDVSVAIPWPVSDISTWVQHHRQRNNLFSLNHSSPAVEVSQVQPLLSSVNNSYFFDRFSVTWPEEKLPVPRRGLSPHGSFDFTNGGIHKERSALGMVIVTASLKGQIRIFQNFGLPVRL